MKLAYRIVWIEDNEEYIDAFDQDALKQHIEGQGFDLNLDFRLSPDEIAADVDGNAFDLMIIDYQITEGDVGAKTGADVIRSVRDHDCLTEVIFYSGTSLPVLRNLAADNELEGVFFSDRDHEGLLRKICDVFDLTVRKVVDTDNMRGIVMAGIADIDLQLTELLLKLHERLDAEEKEKHHQKIFKRMLEGEKSVKKLVTDQENVLVTKVSEAIKALAELVPKDIHTLVALREFDSYKRVEVTASLCGKHREFSDEKNLIKEIQFLLKWRNALAHQSPKMENNVFIFEPDLGVPEPFDDKCTLDLRQRLRKHKKHLDVLLDKVRTNGQE